MIWVPLGLVVWFVWKPTRSNRAAHRRAVRVVCVGVPQQERPRDVRCLCSRVSRQYCCSGRSTGSQTQAQEKEIPPEREKEGGER